MTATRQTQAPKTRVPESSATRRAKAPTGSNISAQGESRSAAALGLEPQNASSPERAKQSGQQPPKLLDQVNEALAA
jgi:hypothetical protein